MRLYSQTKVALATAACLVAQGYIFEYFLEVKPSVLVSLAPLILYIIYIITRSRLHPRYRNPIYWIFAVVLLTLADVGAYSF